MHRKPAILFLSIFQQRKIHHPMNLIIIWITQSQPRSHLQTQLIQLLPNLIPIPTQNQHQISRFRPKSLPPNSQIRLRIKFIHRRFDHTIRLNTRINQPFGPDLRPTNKIRQLVQLLPRIFRSPLRTNPHHRIRRIKHLKILPTRHVHSLSLQLHKFHPKPNIRLI